MQINPQKMNPNYPLNPMQIWHWSMQPIHSQKDIKVRKAKVDQISRKYGG